MVGGVLLSGMVKSLEVHTKHDFPTFAGFEPVISSVRNVEPSHAFPSCFELTHVAVDCNQLRFSYLNRSLLQVVVSINFYLHRHLGKSSNVTSIFPTGCSCWNFSHKNYPRQAGGGISCWHFERQ